MLLCAMSSPLCIMRSRESMSCVQQTSVPTTKSSPAPQAVAAVTAVQKETALRAQLAVTQSDSSSADQSDPRSRAQIDTSSVAPPADATSSETGSVHRESAPVIEVVDMTRLPPAQAQDMNSSWRVLKPRIQASKMCQ